jgi:hypothetical protein
MDVHPWIERAVDRAPAHESARRAIEQLRAAAAVPASAGEFSPQLRASVVGYVDELRGEGVPVERTLEKVVRLVRDAEGEGWRGDTTDPLLTHVVRWSIEAYYDDPALRGVPRFF